MARRDRLLRFNRQHGAEQPTDRCELERAGWRTTLEYRENHSRGRDGRLQHLQVEWFAVAERESGGDGPTVVTATGSTVDKVWSRLRTQAEVADVSARRARESVRVLAV